MRLLRSAAAAAVLLGLTAVPGAAAPRGPVPRTTAYVTGPEVVLEAVDAVRTEYRVDGGRWRTYRVPAAETVFDGTRASFERWRHLGAGSFALTRQGTLRTEGGLGMLWYPVKVYGAAEIHLRWRALPPPPGTGAGESRGNSGVVIRFPDPVAMTADPTQRQPCQGSVGLGSQALFLPEYAALLCGNEVQINDASPADPQRTASVYDFDFLHDPEQRPVPAGQWVDYVVRVTGGEEYTVTVLRDGHLVNEWVNTPGQLGWRSGCYCGVPAEYPGDSPSDLRRFATGFLGLQNHGPTDVVEFGTVTVRPLSGAPLRFQGVHRLDVRSVSATGVVEPVQTYTVGRPVLTPPLNSCQVGPTPGSCTYTATGPGSYDARTTGTWSIRLTRGTTTWVVANHTSAPSMPVQGGIPARKGDRVTVTLGPELVSERDDNVPSDGALGTVQAGDG